MVASPAGAPAPHDAAASPGDPPSVHSAHFPPEQNPPTMLLSSRPSPAPPPEGPTAEQPGTAAPAAVVADAAAAAAVHDREHRDQQAALRRLVDGCTPATTTAHAALAARLTAHAVGGESVVTGSPSVAVSLAGGGSVLTSGVSTPTVPRTPTFVPGCPRGSVGPASATLDEGLQPLPPLAPAAKAAPASRTSLGASLTGGTVPSPLARQTPAVTVLPDTPTLLRPASAPRLAAGRPLSAPRRLPAPLPPGAALPDAAGDELPLLGEKSGGTLSVNGTSTGPAGCLKSPTRTPARRASGSGGAGVRFAADTDGGGGAGEHTAPMRRATPRRQNNRSASPLPGAVASPALIRYSTPGVPGASATSATGLPTVPAVGSAGVQPLAAFATSDLDPASKISNFGDPTPKPRGVEDNSPPPGIISNDPGAPSMGGSSIGDASFSSMGSDALSELAREGNAEPPRGLSVAFHWLDRRVPFALQVAVLMLLPVGFLVVNEIRAVERAASSSAFIKASEPFLVGAGTMQHALMLERGVTSQLLAVREAAAVEAAGGDMVPDFAPPGGLAAEAKGLEDKLLASRRGSDAAIDICVGAGTQSPDPPTKSGLLPRMREAGRQLHALRARVDSTKDISGAEVRAQITEFTALATEGRAAVMRAAAVQQRQAVAELIAAWGESDAIGRCRAVGAALLATRQRRRADIGVEGARLVVAEGLLRELRACYLMQTFHSQQYAAMTQETAAAGNYSTPEVAAAKQAVAELLAAPHTFKMAVSAWFALFTAAVDSQLDLVGVVRGMVARDEAAIVAAGVTACVGCAASFLAALFITFAQMRVSRRTQRALTISRDVQRAVLSFVPRPFLRMGGYTGIVQVFAGEPTEVAVTMLFSDIRSFTTLAEQMSNDELFDWLQSYFARMTSITESNHGFVAEFIGDAVSAIFTHPRHAVRCAIQMQSAVKKLNSGILCGGGEFLITAGVGIHHGLVAVGFTGDQRRLSPTLVSPGAMLATALEGLTKRYGCSILASDAAWGMLAAEEQAGLAHRYLGRVERGTRGAGTGTAVGMIEVTQSDDLRAKLHKKNTQQRFEAAVKSRDERLLAAAKAGADGTPMTGEHTKRDPSHPRLSEASNMGSSTMTTVVEDAETQIFLAIAKEARDHGTVDLAAEYKASAGGTIDSIS